MCQRILGAQVDVTPACTNGVARNCDRFDEAEWIAFHEHAVGECAAVAFVGIACDVLLIAFGSGGLCAT